MLAKRRFFDALTAVVLSTVLLILGLMTLNAGQPLNADDYAGYLNEAIAISEGRLEEQIRMNPMMHPSPAPFLKADDEVLTYVWGYPLVLSLIHRMFGFDTWNYSTIIYYKLPVVLAYSALGAVLFLFYRRRFSWGVSLFLSIAFSLNRLFFPELNTISPDIPFLLFSLLCILLIEVALDEKYFGRQMLWFTLLGCCLWYTYVLRLNGFTILLIVALAHAIRLFTDRKTLSLRTLVHLLPYTLFAVLLFISYLFLPVPTSNLSDLGSLDLSTFLGHFPYYFTLFSRWLASLFARETSSVFYAIGVGPVMLILMVVGMIKSDFRRHLHLLAFTVFTIVTLFLLSYHQGLRYLYTILPFVLMYAAYGAAFVYKWLRSHMDSVLEPIFTKATRWLAVLVCTTLLVQTGLYSMDRFTQRGDSLSGEDQYSTYSIDLYHFIQEYTPEDCTIAYYKPRALYLNTGRMSFKPQMPDELIYSNEVFLPYQPCRFDLTDADYILISNKADEALMRPYGEQLRAIIQHLDGIAELECIYQTSEFELYQVHLL